VVSFKPTLKWLPVHVISFLSLLVILRTFLKPEAARQCDFFSMIYPAACLALHGKWDMLYADSTVSDLNAQGIAFDVFAHRLIPWLSPDKVSNFSNFPVAACLLAPLGWFDPQNALVLFTAIQLIVLIVCARIFVGESQIRLAAKVTWLSLSFLPIADCLLMGQVDILIGLLPVVWGFCKCLEGEFFLGGLIWSLTFLKPQFFIMPLIVALSLAAAKRTSCLAGISAGVAALIAIALALASGETLSSWLHQLNLMNQNITTETAGHAQYLFAALRLAIVASVPPGFGSLAGQLVLAAGCLLALLAVIKCRKKFMNEPIDKAFISTTLVGLYLTPIIAPYLFIYSLSFFWLAGALAFISKYAQHVSALQRRTIELTWVVVNVYFLACFTSAFINPHQVLNAPLLLAIPLTILGIVMFTSL
jgi:hypothetical protein